MRILLTLLLLVFALFVHAQSSSLQGVLKDAEGAPVVYANIALFQASDSVMVKASASDDAGKFELQGLKPGNYYLKAIYLGLSDLYATDLTLSESQDLNLGVLSFSPSSIELAEATITASRALVEVRADRMVFNVEGTINSVGSDALSLLRKAPSVTVDNNDNISVLGRSGVLLYVDGKRLPLTGTDLSNYLLSLPAEQIDRIEIISNPGAKYEAEGNAGIIDIRLKRDKSYGANGSLNSTYSQGVYHRANLNGTGNYRNKLFNTFVTGGIGEIEGFHNMDFDTYLNNIYQHETNNSKNASKNYNFRVGTDFFIGKNHTLGFLVNVGENTSQNTSTNRITLSPEETPAAIDSILIANNKADNNNKNQTYNLNYRFDNGKNRTLNIDLDYGRYRNTSERYQPNQYYNATETTLLSQNINAFDTPTDIGIYSVSADYEDNLWGGKIGGGFKITNVVSDNTFLFYNVNVEDGMYVQNDSLSNIFKYDEKVYAAYVNYSRAFGKKWNAQVGLRTEKTDAVGDLQTFRPELQEPPVVQDYLSWFPNAGVTWEVAPQHALALNVGRRINRPDYNVLNPFNNQLSELSYEKGNPFLLPEIVNNVELGYTLAYRYNLKVGYSVTTDQITRLIAPDEDDPRASFITWANLAEQKILSMNISAPVQITEWWNAYFNISGSYIDNQADYGDGAVVDVQTYNYVIYQQHTFNLPWKLTGEVSGYYSGPGVWGGVFIYESNWGLDLGLQRKFLEDRLNIRLSASDLFYENGWDGYSDFNGMYSEGGGRWDSRRYSISAGYRFGNENVKSRKRSTGIEAEAGRVGQ